MSHFRHTFASSISCHFRRTELHHIPWRLATHGHIANVRPSSIYFRGVSQSRLYNSNLSIYRPSYVWRWCQSRSDRGVQHRLRQASGVPASVGSLQYPLSLYSSHPLASSLLLPRPSPRLSYWCPLLQMLIPWLYTTRLMKLPLESTNTSTTIQCLDPFARIRLGQSHGRICAIPSPSVSIV